MEAAERSGLLKGKDSRIAGRVSPALQQIDDVPHRAGDADGTALKISHVAQSPSTNSTPDSPR